MKIEHHRSNFHLPHFELPQAMQLSPVPADDDELTQAIESDPVTHDNNWVLTAQLDQDELNRSSELWDRIVEDVHSDPEWFKESDEDLAA